MKVLITGICGYVGSHLARCLQDAIEGIFIYGLDNLSRRGAEKSVGLLKRAGITLVRGDVRLSSDFDGLPPVDWVIDCAANPAVLAGLSAVTRTSSRQLVQHNLLGTLNTLEYCRKSGAGLILLSSSRVYSINELSSLSLCETETRFMPSTEAYNVPGFSQEGVMESFSTASPISLYGATKLASEKLSLEYGYAFDFPVWINRCGVIGGPGQFGKVDQGILSFWVYSYMLRRPLQYIGFNGEGKQVRDFVKAEDIANLIVRQLNNPERSGERIFNVGGGNAGALSLQELTAICQDYFGYEHEILPSKAERPYDIPYYVTDTRFVRQIWGWQPSLDAKTLTLELCEWAVNNHSFVEWLLALS
jgi:CDP-paratose 2-epimerase